MVWLGNKISPSPQESYVLLLSYKHINHPTSHLNPLHSVSRPRPRTTTLGGLFQSCFDFTVILTREYGQPLPTGKLRSPIYEFHIILFASSLILHNHSPNSFTLPHALSGICFFTVRISGTLPSGWPTGCRLD